MQRSVLSRRRRRAGLSGGLLSSSLGCMSQRAHEQQQGENVTQRGCCLRQSEMSEQGGCWVLGDGIVKQTARTIGYLCCWIS